MRISRKKRPKKLLIPKFNLNNRIEAPEVRLIGAEGENLGIFTTREALNMAREQELDLVEINPKAVPPIAQILDFTHFKYQKEKEARKQKARTHVAELKGIRLSMRISEGDMGVRQKQAEKFLSRGDKVKVEIILRGRERGKSQMAYEIIKTFVTRLEENTSIRHEQEPTRQGNKITAIVAKK
ncbi:MAG: translation initiation factor IF-3 [Candidatus Magasanikbacteria bacterium]|jgi:translation initiation factor IF-3|nr:translation initiation factor IF-3 [Candidatus Magasanikbacteria bacterium]MBT4220837.1 translation initiation factor IF-3 [Candidatus Magasanikbacteria bacterium]MBT4350182.1 translation initiation factor IF-3 [Candidatus Magasanikbacteria bacterium]MBT4541375.1 translation initiation factor IF-3 [Candidatus Magasanikbacteria bacterium]MBT6253185.1 translation initiation factor IF-3 [Candidatus Magasanikbacteria bacterium]